MVLVAAGGKPKGWRGQPGVHYALRCSWSYGWH